MKKRNKLQEEEDQATRAMLESWPPEVRAKAFHAGFERLNEQITEARKKLKDLLEMRKGMKKFVN